MNTIHQLGDVVHHRYRILSALGQGGMGITYEAEDLQRGEHVALKVLSLQQLSDWKALELFEREAKVLENIHHSAIPRYIEHFQVDTPNDRLFYLIQQLAEGESLATLIDRGCRVTEEEVQQIAIQILQILNYLHRLSPPVIHRDIKPQNIIRRRDGQIFLVDFGAVQSAYRNTIAAGGTFVGTYGYMPPEQFRGQAFFASDLYSLGATLLFLLTGRSPADLPQRRMKIEFREWAQVSDSFAHWLDKLLEPAIEDRFQSAAEALNALQHPIAIVPGVDAISPVIQKPKGSRILIERGYDRLTIQIPPAGLFNPGTLFLGAFAIFWNGFILVWTSFALFGALATGAWFFPLFSIPFWLVGVAMIWGLMFAIAGTSHLELDWRSFCIGWKCLGFKGQYESNTSDISKVEVDVTINDGSRRTQFVIWEGIHKRNFGQGITEVEQQWLTSEVNQFLQQVRSRGGDRL